jgi:hypothetical protein
LRAASHLAIRSAAAAAAARGSEEPEKNDT